MRRKITAGLFILCMFSSTFALTGTVTVKRELTIKTSSDGKISEGGWKITVTCVEGGREQTFQLTTTQYIRLKYYEAVHRAERAGAKVTFDGKTTLDNLNGVEIFTDTMSQSTTYQGECPRPSVSV